VSVDLTHEFSVPTPVEETWDRFQDISALAECFPGAQVTSVEGDTFKGTVKVKLGPIALVYAGSGTFVEKDEVAHKLVVEAKGRDKRGNGTAGATATLTMVDSGGSTAVTVVTDLSITGKPAQFGRGVMQDVSDKLLGQFVACLEQQSVAAPAEESPAGAPSVEPASAASGVERRPEEPRGTSGVSNGTNTADAAGPATDSVVPRESGSTSGGGGAAPTGQDDVINLGATVLPVLVKSYWKQGLAGLAVLLVLLKLLRRGGN